MIVFLTITALILFSNMNFTYTHDNYLMKPIPFKKSSKFNMTNSSNFYKKQQMNYGAGCAWSDYGTLTSNILKILCGRRQYNKSFDSNAWSKSVSSKIINGTHAKVGEWPWQAFLQFFDDKGHGQLCGGALITDEVILTAAHCFPKDIQVLRRIQILLGGIKLSTVNQQSFFAKDYKLHEQYNPVTFDNDIALILLGRKVKFDCNIAPVCLPYESEFATDDLTNVWAWVAGYGVLDTLLYGVTPKQMWEVRLKIISNEDCSVYHEGIFEGFLCTFRPGKDVCRGDSGGPFVYNFNNRWHEVALVSHVFECGMALPTVNTRITYYMSWIRKHVPII